MQEDGGLTTMPGAWFVGFALALACLALRMAWPAFRRALLRDSAQVDDELAAPDDVELSVERARRLDVLRAAMGADALRIKRHSESTAAGCALAEDADFHALCTLAASDFDLSLAELDAPSALLGRGAFSTIELRRVSANSPRLAGALYAVKRLLAPSPDAVHPPAAAAHATADDVRAFEVASLMAEGALLRTIRHPNLIGCDGAIGAFGAAGATDAANARAHAPIPPAAEPPPAVRLCALLLEYAPGGSLRERLDARDYPPARALGWLVGVARALAHLHALGIVHRDVKPANVLEDANGTAKLCDFGLVRFLPPRSSAAIARRAAEPPPSPSKGGVTSAATPAAPQLTARTGTLAYMAPELWMPAGAYDEKVDIFAFAVTAWELLTMRLAYADLTAEPERIAELVARKGMRPYLPPVWPPALRALLRACLAAEPARRPSARAALRVLEALERRALDGDELLLDALAVRPLPCSSVFEQSGGGGDPDRPNVACAVS
ncbi:hypothetical protein KFE25_012121 [Diacronema lutheri]|uniref:Protein kinase domain-containing protein n=1 Tax=Diacronema lutheri TaxID=2081491 RepID=A0A8J5XBB4_DIALT|nr:hypothetical protein KFE25_012121 [Diacronema lutheri]